MFGRDPKIRELNKLLKTHVDAGTFSGVVLVEHRGKITYQKAHGLAHHELRIPLDLDKRFNIGSISKLLTALAVLELESQSKLSLSDPLSAYLPDFPGAGITLHHLLSNTSGLPDYLFVEDTKEGWYALPQTPTELLGRIADLPREFAAGEGFGYSNSNWVVLAQVVEAVTKLSFEEALRGLVLEPFDLKDTILGSATGLIPKRVTGYRLEGKQVGAALPINPSAELGAGGLFSTATDLLKLIQTLSKSSLLKRILPTSKGYGYGVMLAERWEHAWFGHSGGTFGFSTFLTHYPEDKLTVIVLSNFENGSAATLELDVAAVILGAAYNLPASHTFITPNPDVLNKHCGTYQSQFMGRPIPFKVTCEAEQLTVKFPFLAAAKLQAVSETSFVGRLKGGEVVFDFHADGVSLDWAGEVLECPRI